MNFGIVICSRQESERIPNKPFKEINNLPILGHLLNGLFNLKLPIILAVPTKQKSDYITKILNKIDPKVSHPLFIMGSRHNEDPLARTYEAANKYGLDAVIRITHDKIFVDTESLKKAVEVFKNEKPDYLYSSDLIPGTGFEIFSTEALFRASVTFKNVEFLSYALRLVSQKTINFKSKRPEIPHNLLIDFPEDLKLHELIISQVGAGANLDQVIKYLSKNPELSHINKPPIVSIYTCAFNGAKYLQEAMESVVLQTAFKTSMEYLLIDDCSTDNTCELMAKFAIKNKNTFWFRNPENKGLASSSNFALKKARGRFIIRLDADDFFTSKNSIMEMVNIMQSRGCEALYPNNYFGSFSDVQCGSESHHVGGAMFDKKAINFIKFTEGLRGYEGLDFFVRATDKLNVAYYKKPTFFYRQHEGSLTKNNLEEREKIRKEIIEGATAL